MLFFHMETTMPNQRTPDYTVEEIEVDDFEANLDDFTFVIGSDGDLKSITVPQHLMDDPPEEVQCILKLFGIDDINTLEDRTLH